ncbi:hypothetical protein GOODEAATRI_025522 [Goodea atripinnis]|uniref:Secreted protein n=1 Tax=Goodea atripinnis TaxID=208336 RepID=A0ABV0PGZ4_9TELE
MFVCWRWLVFVGPGSVYTPTWLCNVKTERALAQRQGSFCWMLHNTQCTMGQYTNPKHNGGLLISRKTKNAEQTVPAFHPERLLSLATHYGPVMTSLSTLLKTY